MVTVWTVIDTGKQEGIFAPVQVFGTEEGMVKYLSEMYRKAAGKLLGKHYEPDEWNEARKKVSAELGYERWVVTKHNLKSDQEMPGGSNSPHVIEWRMLNGSVEVKGARPGVVIEKRKELHSLNSVQSPFSSAGMYGKDGKSRPFEVKQVLVVSSDEDHGLPEPMLPELKMEPMEALAFMLRAFTTSPRLKEDWILLLGAVMMRVLAKPFEVPAFKAWDSAGNHALDEEWIWSEPTVYEPSKKA